LAKGSEHNPASLSVGTRDQLAMVVRLALARYLKSVLLLDDQLVQADPRRLEWFRARLHASVRDYDHQIIVLTCRPLDYLHPEEIPAPPCDRFEAEGGRLVAVALEHSVCCQ
jgi:uncharacterized protein YhaN